ncbi:MAG: sulfotransferase family protein [Pseudomonadota bacterium]
MNPIIAMWAHQRAMSTAFLRMMIERGDVTVIHEPLVTLIDEGEVALPDGRGGQVVVRSEQALFAQMRELARDKPVFFKDTVEHRYDYLFEHPEDVADIEHTFIVREPRRTISSMYNMKPTITSPEIGYEHLHEIFELARRMSGRVPAVVSADRMIEDPAAAIRRWCDRVGLPFIERALTWKAEDRPEWSRTRKWHMDVINSTGFTRPSKTYSDTVETNPVLQGFYSYHQPFYQQIVQHAL